MCKTSLTLGWLWDCMEPVGDSVGHEAISRIIKHIVWLLEEFLDPLQLFGLALFAVLGFVLGYSQDLELSTCLPASLGEASAC